MNKMKKGRLISKRAPSQSKKKFRPKAGIGAKIILPYLALTLVVAGVGAFIISSLVASSLQERLNNQLLDAGRLVSESIVNHEAERLRTLSVVAETLGVPEAVHDADVAALAGNVPQIIAIHNNHAVKLLNMDGVEIYGWQQLPHLDPAVPSESYGEDFSQNEEIQKVLGGVVDEYGDKRVLLHETQGELTLYTAGPIFLNGEQVGVVMVGDEVRQTAVDLTIAAIARVTLYDKNGRVLVTTLGGGQESADFSPAALNESPERYQQVINNSGKETYFREVNIMEQEYLMAFTDWRLRGQSVGMFSVALPSNFILTTLATGRNTFSAIFALATVAVLAVGFLTAQQIIRPVDKLVQTALAVSEGDLEQRSGIESSDEIGKLAETFDFMTTTLSERNRQLTEQASKLEAILDSIADGVIVLDMSDQFITINTAAQKLLADMSHDFNAGPLRELTIPRAQSSAKTNGAAFQPPVDLQSKRYQIGNRILNAQAAPVLTPDDERIGTVIILRDITSEAEADQLKDAFITSISHELRTPLTVIKVYTDLILKTSNSHMDERLLGFLQKISVNSDHLEQHINRLINISEIQAGTFHPDKKRIDFVALVRALTEKWQERMASKALTFEMHLPTDPIWIEADSDQLSWAVEVLLNNALNYTLEGGVKVRVFAEQGEVRLDVEDTGIGIAAADQPRLFDRFFRAANAVNYHVRGVGLGLFITRSIVGLHNGRIWLKSESGVGSVFSFTLPVAGERVVE